MQGSRRNSIRPGSSGLTCFSKFLIYEACSHLPKSDNPYSRMNSQRRENAPRQVVGDVLVEDGKLSIGDQGAVPASQVLEHAIDREKGVGDHQHVDQVLREGVAEP